MCVLGRLMVVLLSMVGSMGYVLDGREVVCPICVNLRSVRVLWLSCRCGKQFVSYGRL